MRSNFERIILFLRIFLAGKGKVKKEYSDCVDVIQTAVDEGHAIGFEHGPSAQASYLTSQGVIEEMFQDIITNGTDVETAAKAAEDKLNDIFDTMIS